MKLRFTGPRITGVQLVLPKNEVLFDDEITDYSFSQSQSQKLKLVMGYNSRRVVQDGVTSSDLVIAGMENLVSNGILELKSIDALIVVTQTPDFLLPGTSFVIHGQLELKKDTFCLDINQGCAGYIVGIQTAFSLMSQSSINRVVLVNVDVLSRLVGKGDRNSRPIIGDAASITIIDSTSDNCVTFGNIMANGSGWDSLIVPAGGMRIRPTPQTALPKSDSNGNLRSLDNLVMKGDAVFNFVMQEVPPMIQSLLQDGGVQSSQVDNFVFHQPNAFMLKKLSEKLAIPKEKMPMDLVRQFGNSSGVSIPAVLCTSFDEAYFKKPRLMCFAGFGVGLTWGSLLINISDLSFVRVLEV